MYLGEDLAARVEGGRQSSRRCGKQPDGCTDTGGRGLKRFSVEVWGEQSGEQGLAVLIAGLQGTGKGKEGEAVLSHTLEAYCTADIFTQS